MPTSLDQLLSEIKNCRICRDSPDRSPLPHEPRPVLRVSRTARIAVCGQAPGTRVHKSGTPFTDPSGDRLRTWMAVTEDEFYDTNRIAIVPMGFCFPGLDAKGGDLPPRRECARRWRSEVFAHLPDIELVLLIGHYAQKWHLGPACRGTLTETVAQWRDYAGSNSIGGPSTIAVPCVPLPHPSWRNNAWLKKNPWFEAEVLPFVQSAIRRSLDKR